MNTRINFELAKLLKEKGFVCNESNNFWMNGFSYSKKDYNPITYRDKDNVPTIAEVVMWLYEKHGIWIVILPELLNGTEIRYYPSVFEQGVGEDVESYFNSPTEAYQKAINYTLTNLI